MKTAEKFEEVPPTKHELIVAAARKLFARMKWPVIDVTRRSIEETATAILQHYAAARERAAAPGPASRGR